MEKDYRSLEQKIRDVIINEKTNTQKRMEVTNVSRPGDATDPTDTKEKQTKQDEIKKKIIDETLAIDFINTVLSIVEKKDVNNKMTGGKTQVDLEPTTDDKVESENAETAASKKTAKAENKKIGQKGAGLTKEPVKEALERKIPEWEMTPVKRKNIVRTENKPHLERVGGKEVKEDNDILSQEEIERIESIANEMNEAPTALSAPIGRKGGAFDGNPGSSEDESGVGVKHNNAAYTISDEAYPMTYVKLHKDPKNSTKVTHAEFHHTNLDFGSEKPKTSERVNYLVKNNDKHKKLKNQGYSIETYGEHKKRDTYYTYPVKYTKEEVELTELIAGVGAVKQTMTPQSRVTSHTGGSNAPVQAKSLQRASQMRVREKEQFAHDQKDHDKREREQEVKRRESERKKRESLHNANEENTPKPALRPKMPSRSHIEAEKIAKRPL